MKTALRNLLVYIFFCTQAWSQNDCPDAITVCWETFDNIHYNAGPGLQELNGTNVCSGQEENSLWFKIEIVTGGIFDFYIVPRDNQPVDYNFWLFGPAASCGSLGSAIRCSTTERRSAQALNENITGTYPGETDTVENPGQGNGFVSPVNVQAGQTYYLLVNEDGNSDGFFLAFNGTAKLKPFVSYTYSGSTTEHHVLEKCDNDGVNDLATSFNLREFEALFTSTESLAFTYYATQNDAMLNHNVITNNTSYTNTEPTQVIYARIESIATGCFFTFAFIIKITNTVVAGEPQNLQRCDTRGNGIQTFNLTANTSLVQNTTGLPVSYYASREDAVAVTNPLPVLYQNTSREQTIWARLSGTGSCYMYDLKTFTLTVPEIPEIAYTLTINDLLDSQNSIEVNVTNAENYLYAVDNQNFGTETYFYNLSQGQHTFYIKPVGGCGVVQSEIFYIMGYPKCFTPNNDGFNDTWRIPYITTRPDSHISIFNRYGKLITTLDYRSVGWDGMLNDTPLPADDYWFILHLAEGRTVKGHFSLLR